MDLNAPEYVLFEFRMKFFTRAQSFIDRRPKPTIERVGFKYNILYMQMSFPVGPRPL